MILKDDMVKECKLMGILAGFFLILAIGGTVFLKVVTQD